MLSQIINIISNNAATNINDIKNHQQQGMIRKRKTQERGTRLMTTSSQLNNNNIKSIKNSNNIINNMDKSCLKKRLLLLESTTTTTIAAAADSDNNNNSMTSDEQKRRICNNADEQYLNNKNSTNKINNTNSIINDNYMLLQHHSSSSSSTNKSQPLYQNHHNHLTSNSSSSSSSASSNYSWRWSILSSSFMFILACQIFSHQLFYCCSASDATSTLLSSSTTSNLYNPTTHHHLHNFETDRAIRGGGNSHKNKLTQKNNNILDSSTNNKMYHHNRSPVTIPTTTSKTTANRPSKLKPPNKSKTNKIKAKPNKIRTNKVENAAVAHTNSMNFNHGNNRPKYMKFPKTQPPEPNYYLSTMQMLSSSTLSPNDESNHNDAPLKLPMTWNPSAPDISSSPNDMHSDTNNSNIFGWRGSFRPTYIHKNHNYNNNNAYTFSSTTSRSMSRLPPPPSFQFIQPQIDPLSVLTTDVQTTAATGESKTTPSDKKKSDKTNDEDADVDANDDDDDDEDDDGINLLGRSNLDFGKMRSPIYERTTEKLIIDLSNSSKSSSGLTSGKKLVSNFFDNFEDHWDDPIADETRGPQSVSVAKADGTPVRSPQGISGSSAAIGPGNPKNPQPTMKDGIITDQYPTTGTGPSSPEHGYLNPPTIQNYPPHHHFHHSTLNGQHHNPGHFKNGYFSTHKNPNYWPQKLNSYYGQQVTSQVVKQAQTINNNDNNPHLQSPRPTQPKQQQQQQMLNFRHNHPPPHLRARFPPPQHPPSQFPPHVPSSAMPIPSSNPLLLNQQQSLKLQNSFPFQYMQSTKHPLHHPHHLHTFPTGPSTSVANSLEEEEETNGKLARPGTTAMSGTTAADGNENDLYEGSESSPNQKLTMIDRVSTFYTNYKLLAWGGIILLISLGLLGAIVTLYMSNPPTEVVTAKRDLVTRLTDPTVLRFLQHLMDGDAEENETTIEKQLGLKNETTNLSRTKRNFVNNVLENLKIKTRRKRYK